MKFVYTIWAEYLKICVETYSLCNIYECVEAYEISWQIPHILCQLTFLYLGSNEPPQNLRIQVLLYLRTFNIRTFRNMNKLTLTSSSIFYRFGPVLEPIWNFGNGQKTSCLLSQINPRFLNYPACSLMTTLTILPQLCHCVYTQQHQPPACTIPDTVPRQLMPGDGQNEWLKHLTIHHRSDQPCMWCRWFCKFCMHAGNMNSTHKMKNEYTFI